MAIQGRSAVAAKPVAAKPLVGGAPTKLSPSAVVKEAIIKVEITKLENGTIKGEPVVSEEREVKLFMTSTANAGVTVQYTRNLGNFESTKIAVMVNMPCYTEEFDSAFAQVLDKAKTTLEEALETLQIAPSEAGEEAAAEEGTEESTEAAAEGGEGEVDLEYLKAQDRDGLIALIEANPDWGLDAADYTEEDDLRQVVIQAGLGEEALQAYLAEQGGSEEAVAYTQESLKALTTDNLKEIFVSWELGDYPKGPAPIAKNVAIKKILEAQGG